MPLFKRIVAGLSIASLLIYGAVPVAQANRLAEFRVPHEIAKFIASHLPSQACAVIVAESLEGAVPMPYQRIWGQLGVDKDHLLCAALIAPQSIANIEEFIQARNIRYVAVFGGDWARSGSDEMFLQLLANASFKKKIVFSRDEAILYELVF